MAGENTDYCPTDTASEAKNSAAVLLVQWTDFSDSHSTYKGYQTDGVKFLHSGSWFWSQS